MIKIGEYRDFQLYLFRTDLLKSPLLPDINPWKLVVLKKLRPQVLKENHEELQSGHLGSEKHTPEYLNATTGQGCIQRQSTT